MTLAEADLFHFLLAASLLLFSAHAVGMLFARWHQPRVVGEILGGFMLGPTVLGAIAPGVQAQLVPASGPAATALGALYQLGLIWLMFAAGTELRMLPSGRERTVAASVALAGMALPFAAGIVAFAALQPTDLAGPANSTTALGLVFIAALAVTSIPVISRIMMDLGLLSTPFARIVLGAAVIEDIVLFGVLGVAIGLTQSSAESSGLASLIGIESGSPIGAIYYGAVVTTALGGAIALSRRRSRPDSVLNRMCSDLTLQILFVLGAVTVLLLISAPPLFGGLVAGLVVGNGERTEATERLKAYGLAFFVPIYFAIVGFRLDLNVLQPAFFMAFFLFACGVKAGGVYLGARVSRVGPPRAADLAVAMNARGGPGIVLATVALDAKIIDNGFYASLVLLAIISSLLAGWWLERRVSGKSGAHALDMGWNEPHPPENHLQGIAPVETPSAAQR
jgi:K+:H+ antiporter